jgi:zinc transport system permease protein
MTFDRESARVSGVRVGRLDALLMVLTAVTIVLGMKVVGILLVAALIVIPAAAGLQLASSFRMAVLVAAATAALSVLFGLAAAVELDVPASATIVIFCFLVFAVLTWARRKRFSRSR